MTTAQQEMMDALSNNVTALAQAIDPTGTHGPETQKLVEYQAEVRKWTLTLVQTTDIHETECQSAAQTKAARKLRELLVVKG